MADAGLLVSVDASSALAGMAKHQKLTILRLRSWSVKHANAMRNSMVKGLRWKSGKGQPGGLATGTLRRSIVWGVTETPGTIDTAVGPGVAYGRYLEGWNKAGEHKPVVRHFVPFKTAPGLKKWLHRHGVDVPKKAKGWVVGGPDSVTPFAEPAFRKHVPQALADLKTIVRP